MAEPPPPEPNRQEATFPNMTDAQLIAFLVEATTRWRMVPAALAEANDRGQSFTDLAKTTGLKRSTAHALAQRHRDRTTTTGSRSADLPPDQTASSTA